MNLKKVFDDISNAMSRHSPEILTGAAVVGLGITVILVAKAAPDVDDILDDAKEDLEDEEDDEKRKEIKKETAKKVVKKYAPAAASATITVICIISSNRISAKRQAALASICSASQTALLEYKEAAKEVVGEKKEEDISYKQKQKVINDESIVFTGLGDDLCCEAITGQVSTSSIDYVRNAWNDLDDRMREGDEVTLNDWLYDLHLEQSAVGDNLVWMYDPEHDKRSVKLIITSILTKNGKPCYYIEYSRMPEYA